jgi:hypothetical protein
MRSSLFRGLSTIRRSPYRKQAEVERRVDGVSNAKRPNSIRMMAALGNVDLQAIGSILPLTGISGAVLLSVMTMSYLPLLRSRH